MAAGPPILVKAVPNKRSGALRAADHPSDRETLFMQRQSRQSDRFFGYGRRGFPSRFDLKVLVSIGRTDNYLFNLISL